MDAREHEPAHTLESTLDGVAQCIERASRILFITGAGISADSGLPTYRGVGGLYQERLTDDGLSIEEALSGAMLAHRPELTWKYISEIEANCRDARPNDAHKVIAALEWRKPELFVLTQNVDGLHREAGSQHLIEVHGRIHRLRCTECHHARDVQSYAGLKLPPECPVCGSLLRPDVVLFGEMLPEREMAQLEAILNAGLDLVVSVGTTSVFAYIAGPVVWAHQNGIPTVEINPERTTISQVVDHHLRSGAASALRALWQRLYPDEALPD